MPCSKCEPSRIARIIDKIIDAVFMFGPLLATIQSWERYHSTAWALIHGGAGWFYVLAPGIWPHP